MTGVRACFSIGSQAITHKQWLRVLAQVCKGTWARLHVYCNRVLTP